MLIVAQDALFSAHDPGRGHPERPARLDAVEHGVRDSGVFDALEVLDPRDATRTELERVHDAALLDQVQQLSAQGGGMLDGDTTTSSASWSAAVRAAGAGLAAVDALTEGRGRAAFLGLRPPGHHATTRASMGFCLVNHIAVTAAALAERGERVAIIDYDAHHGNGTQEIFWTDPRVLYVSLHQWPLYPGTGRLDDIGVDAGIGTTCNLPLPPGATGDVYRQAFDDVIEPVVERFDPTWVLVSAGFDAHRADPLTGLALSEGDYATLASRVVGLAPLGRLIVFLEGGYDLEALRDSVAATLPPLVGERVRVTTEPTVGGPGSEVVRAARARWAN